MGTNKWIGAAKQSVQYVNCASHASDFLRVIPDQQGGAFTESECWKKNAFHSDSPNGSSMPHQTLPRIPSGIMPYPAATTAATSGTTSRAVFRDLISSAGF